MFWFVQVDAFINVSERALIKRVADHISTFENLSLQVMRSNHLKLNSFFVNFTWTLVRLMRLIFSIGLREDFHKRDGILSDFL